jgi:acetyl-CoA carboxylase biotin carboxyl carrier protein
MHRHAGNCRLPHAKRTNSAAGCLPIAPPGAQSRTRSTHPGVRVGSAGPCSTWAILREFDADPAKIGTDAGAATQGGSDRKNTTRGARPMDLRKLKTLIDLVSESNISELEITEAEGKVRIVKGGAPMALAAMPHAPAAVPAMAAPQSPAAPPGAAAAPEGKVIKSPMVGTFYRAATPDAKPFVDIGEEVKEGQPVCIIEAMKIMNEIEADLAGRVARILVENGQAVEYGQTLFVLE